MFLELATFTECFSCEKTSGAKLAGAGLALALQLPLCCASLRPLKGKVEALRDAVAAICLWLQGYELRLCGLPMNAASRLPHLFLAGPY